MNDHRIVSSNLDDDFDVLIRGKILPRLVVLPWNSITHQPSINSGHRRQRRQRNTFWWYLEINKKH